MAIQKKKNAVLLACVAAVGVGVCSGASAYCITGAATAWSSPSTAKTMKLSTLFPSAMRPWLEGSLATWNMSGSVLVYNAPVYTSTWGSGPFTGEMLSFSAVGFNPYDPATTGAVSTAYGATHSGAAIAFNSDFTWIAGSQNIAFNVADIATVATHEIGHANGLSHPGQFPCSAATVAENASVMKIINTGTRRYPTSDDINYQTWKY